MRNKRGRNEPLETIGEIQSALVDLLARREYSRRELETKFSPRVASVELLDQALDTLIEKGYQSDRRFAEMMVRQRVMQAYGPMKIRHDLASKGIESELLAEVLQSAEADWTELATQALLKRFGALPKRLEPREKARVARHLAGRGFGFDEVRKAIEGATETDFSE